MTMIAYGEEGQGAQLPFGTEESRVTQRAALACVACRADVSGEAAFHWRAGNSYDALLQRLALALCRALLGRHFRRRKQPKTGERCDEADVLLAAGALGSDRTGRTVKTGQCRRSRYRK